MELEFERVHLSRMIEQICSEFEPVLQEKNLTWKLDIEPEITMIGDPDKLSRVFDNLIRNACNYSYPDTEIQCSLKKENDSIVCRIKNHGKTISKEKMGRSLSVFPCGFFAVVRQPAERGWPCYCQGDCRKTWRKYRGRKCRRKHNIYRSFSG